MRRLTALLTLSLLAAACQSAPLAEKGEEEGAPLDGALDSFRSPIDHGALVLGMPVSGELTRDRSFHAWTFELTGEAAVTLRTAAGEGGREVDTMLYLYREGTRGWGGAIARNDDAGGTLFSALSQTLRAGRYRVLVKGYTRASVGRFTLLSECAGAGCPGAAGVCLFGATFAEVGMAHGVTVSNQESLTTVAQLGDDVQRRQLVIAVQQSAHTDVTTPEAALARVDGGTVKRLWLWDVEGVRSFVAYEYGAGDNSYGAIFATGETAVVARIQDGDLAACTVRPETCLFGGSYRAMRDSAAFSPVLETVVTSATAGALSAPTQAQLVAAVKTAYTDVTGLPSAFAAVDRGLVNLLEVRETATGRTFRAFEYGAGDNSYGAIFAGDDAAVVARIQDGDLAACSVFGARMGARAGADCGAEGGAPCAEGLSCRGFVESWGAGKCSPTARLPGEGDPCSAQRACASEQLVCGGLTRGEQGVCVPLWMRGSVGAAGPLASPDARTAGLVSGGTLYGLATVDTDVELRALLQHPRHADLRITLTNPAGTEVVVFDGAAGSGALELDGPVRGFSGDESVNGAWLLKVVDSRRGSTGTLERWAVDVTSRWD